MDKEDYSKNVWTKNLDVSDVTQGPKPTTAIVVKTVSRRGFIADDHGHNSDNDTTITTTNNNNDNSSNYFGL